MNDEPCCPAAAICSRCGTQTVRGHGHRRSSTRSTSTPSSTSAAKTLGTQRHRLLQSRLDQPIAFDPYAREPRPRRLHPDRPLHQRTRSAAGMIDFALRRAHQHPLAGARRRHKAARAALKQPEAVRPVVHRPVAAPASRPSPIWSRSGCTRSAATPTCSTATTSATASTATSASPRPTASRTSAASPRWRS